MHEDLRLARQEIERLYVALGKADTATRRRQIPAREKVVQEAEDALSSFDATKIDACLRLGINLQAIAAAAHDEIQTMRQRWVEAAKIAEQVEKSYAASNKASGVSDT